MKLVSWNVNGLRAVLAKNFQDVLEQLQADIFCIQETKLSEETITEISAEYTPFWNHAEKKGYSGTATLTRLKPLKASNGIGEEIHDHEGRMITLEFENFFLVNVYTPNSQNQLARLQYRLTWEDSFLDYITRLDAQKPVIICGDLNVAHNEIDLKNPKTNHKNAGFTDEERQALQKLLDAGFIDTYRHLHPDSQKYSWWSYRYNARQKGIGWRLDYFLISKRLEKNLQSAEILDDIFGSDHCPITITITNP